ncbi:hypothetical protein PZ897_08195 [Hoeflea sp. YIM 152468]|uniref:hypothetical protein n=1 Tax=Hoeflea sp. YIM 152468 TaxID=3031759 RepID=UPI0023DB3482|nr:hypothetical protein [Hoeflea sp. YIM 152468]MDF1608152.1 hypothetical protein [Hoeflea sp. YIM 152468]
MAGKFNPPIFAEYLLSTPNIQIYMVGFVRIDAAVQAVARHAIGWDQMFCLVELVSVPDRRLLKPDP